MKLFLKQNAEKDFKKLDFQIRVRILKKLQFYISQSNPLQFAEPLKDSRFGEWKFRIGDYRVLFDVEKDKIVVLKIGHRRDIYK
jgi:mRNA interferase RelE/StbE